MFDAKIVAIRQEAEGVLSLELAPADGEGCFPRAAAGSHIDLHLPAGVRSYSLFEPSDGRVYRIAILRVANGRGGSAFVHEQSRVGMRLQISSPRNNFEFDTNKSGSIVFVAGGIGVTPILSMLNSLPVDKKNVHLVYCAKSRLHAAFLERIESMADQLGSVSLHFDCESGGPPDLGALLGRYERDAALYCCGPEAMISSFEETCHRFGFGDVHVERFVGKMSLIGNDGEFIVELARDGLQNRPKPCMI